jgi:hypothetical protein
LPSIESHLSGKIKAELGKDRFLGTQARRRPEKNDYAAFLQAILKEVFAFAQERSETVWFLFPGTMRAL